MSAINRKIFLAGLSDTARMARVLAACARPGDVLALSGEVGAGKTTFAQHFIGALLKTPEPVTSPTFTLVQSYETLYPWRVFHADLYRLKHAAELDELGLQDAFDGHVTLIEWPEIAEALLPPGRLNLHFTLDGEGRNVMMSSNSNHWDTSFA